MDAWMDGWDRTEMYGMRWERMDGWDWMDGKKEAVHKYSDLLLHLHNILCRLGLNHKMQIIIQVKITFSNISQAQTDRVDRQTDIKEERHIDR